jgi:hypothetical protein
LKKVKNKLLKPGLELMSKNLTLEMVGWLQSWIWWVVGWMPGGSITWFKGLLSAVQKVQNKCSLKCFFVGWIGCWVGGSGYFSFKTCLADVQNKSDFFSEKLSDKNALPSIKELSEGKQIFWLISQFVWTSAFSHQQ